MASLSNHVSLTISQDSVGIARAGFGTMLMVSYNTSGWGAGEKTRTYASLADVAADFASTTGPEYLAAQAAFSQSPRPEQIKIGKGTLPPTQKFTITPVVQNSHTYTLTVGGDGVTTTDVSVTSDSSATATEICDALRTALDAVVGKNYATSGTSTLIVTGSAAGEWFWIKINDPADLGIAEDNVDPGIATDLAAILVADSDWYALHTLYNSEAYVKAAAAWVESNKKIYVFAAVETVALTVAADGTQGLLDDLNALNYARSMGAYYPDPHLMMAAAWMGRCLPLEPGSESWKFKQLSGVAAVSMTATQRTNLRNRSANSVETVAGLAITFEGMTFDGDFLDVQRGLDWLEDDMAKGVFGALAGADKIPFTDAGVAVIEAEVRASLQRAVGLQILADDPAPTVTVPKVADVSSSNRALRLLPDVKFSGTLAGAIHKVTITGVVSV